VWGGQSGRGCSCCFCLNGGIFVYPEFRRLFALHTY
jgi:hypothetical protein